MQRNELNFEDDIAIDLDNLHEEWRTHAQDRKKYAVEVSYLEDCLKKVHQREKVCRSKLTLEAKEKGHGNASLQEAYYRTHKDHIKIKDEKIKLEYDLSMAWNALKAFDDRKYALQDEVKLWIKNYFATPREERMVEGGKRIVDINKEKTVKKEREALNKDKPQRRRRS